MQWFKSKSNQQPTVESNQPEDKTPERYQGPAMLLEPIHTPSVLIPVDEGETSTDHSQVEPTFPVDLPDSDADLDDDITVDESQSAADASEMDVAEEANDFDSENTESESAALLPADMEPAQFSEEELEALPYLTLDNETEDTVSDDIDTQDTAGEEIAVVSEKDESVIDEATIETGTLATEDTGTQEIESQVTDEAPEDAGEDATLTVTNENEATADEDAGEEIAPDINRETDEDAGEQIDENIARETDEDAGEQIDENIEDSSDEIAAGVEIVSPQPKFDSGTFEVDDTGKVGIDFLFDGGGYKGEVAIISLDGMDEFEPGSQEFIKEAVRRALSNSELGYLVISDVSEGARFSAELGEANQNAGAYLGVKTFAMRAGDTFGFMLVPNGTLQQLSDNPAAGGWLRPLFSMATANPNDAYHVGQIADVTGDGNTFVIEDMRVDGWTDRDYNDIVFQVRGATGKAALMDEVVAAGKDWRGTDMGQALIEYAKAYITPEEPVDDLEAELGDLIAELEEFAENSDTSGSDIDTSEETSAPLEDVISPTPEHPSENISEIPEIAVELTESASETSTTIVSEEGVFAEQENQSAENSEPADQVESVENPVEVIEPVSETSTVLEKVITEVTESLPADQVKSVENPVEVIEPVSETSTVLEEVVTEVTESLPADQVEAVEAPIEGTEPVSENPTVPEKAVTSLTESLPAENVEVVEASVEVTEGAPQTPTVTKEVDVEPAEKLPANNTDTTEVLTETVKTNTSAQTSPATQEITTGTTNQTQTTATTTLNLEAQETAPKSITPTQSGSGATADLVSRLEKLTESLKTQGIQAATTGGNSVSSSLISKLENLTESLKHRGESTSVSASTTALVSRLEEMVVRSLPKPVQPASPVAFEFAPKDQPLLGVINEAGFTADSPKIDYSRITLGQDRVDGDANPLVSAGESETPASPVLEIIDEINDNAPLVVSRAPGSSEEWAQSLIEYVDAAKASGQPNAIVNLSLNLTEINADGEVVPRYELTEAEWDALAYAQKHNVLVVVPAGDDSETMSVLGQASLGFDNIITVGAAKRINDSVSAWKAYDLADNSGSGYALHILADGSSNETFGTSVAASKVAGAASQVWAANPKLSYRQVVDILQRTATDLKTPNWDAETGSGLLNIAAAVHLAKVTPAIDVDVPVRWLEFEKKNQPLIGIIDTGFNGKNPDIDYSRIILGRDLVEGDNNPLLETGEGNEHGTHVLGIIGATQSNGIGIDGMNDDAPIWLGRAVGSGKWAESLREFVDAAKASAQPNAVVNLSFDLTQINPDGSVTTRYELTPQERQALEYARQNGVMVVVAAGNDGGTMSALGQASQEFDNLITIGSVDDNAQRAAYASFGYGLDLVARGGSPDNQILATVGDGNDLKMLMGEEELSDDEMSVNLIDAFENYLPGFKDAPEIDEDEDLSDFTPEEREAYEQITRDIDASLKEYLAEATQKIAIEYAEGYLGTQVEALESFVEAFDEDMPDVLMKAQELLQQSGFSADIKLDENEIDFALPLDFGVGGMAGTSVAAAKVTGVVSQVWAANPDLSYAQIKEILKKTAVDLGQTGWDLETGAGLVNTAAAIDLARKTVPEAYQPQPIQSPTTWSGQDKVTPSERPVAVSVPPFTGRVMGAGYVTTVGFQRIRSGPGTGYAEVGQKYPGEAITFDAYENNGGWYSDPYVTSSGRWYKIAGTNNWMWAGYIDNSPELAEQERQRQEAIRRAEEEARRAEEEARRAEEELRRIEEEVRRAEEEARLRAEEEARQRQEQLQEAVQQIQSKLGSLGAPIGSSTSKGVSVYNFDKGSLLIQADGRFSFYENPENVTEKGLIINRPYVIEKFFGTEEEYPWKNSLEQTAFLLSGGTKDLGVQDLLSKLGKLAYSAESPPGPNAVVVPRWGSFSKSLDDGLGLFAKTSQQWDDFFASSTAKILRINPATKFGGLYTKAAGKAGVFGAVLGLAPLAYEYFNESKPEEKQKILVKGAFDTAGTLAGAALFSLIPFPGATLVGGFVGGWLGSMAGDWVNENGASTGKAIVAALGIGASAVSSFGSNTVELLKQKLQAKKEEAQAAVRQAKAAYQTAQAAVQTAKVAYQTFKQETQQRATQIVQQSKQKIQQEVQRVAQAAAQASQKVGQKVAQKIVSYAKKAVNTVTNIINGGKQFVNNMINTGKQIVNNIIDTGKKAYETVKTFVTNAYQAGKQVVAATAKAVNNAVNTVANTVSNGWNKAKSLFGW